MLPTLMMWKKLVRTLKGYLAHEKLTPIETPIGPYGLL
jgi:hypothetical protein